MSATTLPIVNAPTLREGMAELLAIAGALAIGQTIGVGVTVWRDLEGSLIDADPDPEVPEGVIVTEAYAAVDPWEDVDPSWRAAEARQALELLHQFTEGDVVAGPDGYRWL